MRYACWGLFGRSGYLSSSSPARDQRTEVTLRQAGLVHVQPARQLLGRGPIPPVADFQDQGMQDVTRRAPLEDGGADLREEDGRDALEARFEVRFGGDGRGRARTEEAWGWTDWNRGPAPA